MRRLIFLVAILAVVNLAPLPAAQADAGRTSGGWYAQLPDALRVCDGNQWNAGPATPPSGAITVPAGDNLGFAFGQTGKTYWFAPGVHTLGPGLNAQVIPGTGSTYIGAPGAVLDGMNANRYAFTGEA